MGQGQRKVIIGIVTSDKMDKSRVIAVERQVRHPLYQKYVKKTSKFMAHDERNESHVGDKVKIIESRPLSKRKRWCIIEILERAK
ncbi:MAG: 30S ribosomal protein S17 [candidate division KSB1 bacterium]|nr:30S ribosomal protein S17 [candidate division KSB1 bacterium]MDZ7370901.1 30S ribosomal protein S17 [candidate division KSB1 bacterium]